MGPERHHGDPDYRHNCSESYYRMPIIEFIPRVDENEAKLAVHVGYVENSTEY